MNTRTNPYLVVDFFPERRSMAAFLDFKSGRHVMYALLEVDVWFMIELEKMVGAF